MRVAPLLQANVQYPPWWGGGVPLAYTCEVHVNIFQPSTSDRVEAGVNCQLTQQVWDVPIVLLFGSVDVVFYSSHLTIPNTLYKVQILDGSFVRRDTL